MSEQFFKIWEKSKWLQEKEQIYSIPFISLQGSRACFPQKTFPESTDYDVRFLYAKPSSEYFTYQTGRGRDTLEHEEVIEIDGEKVNVEFVGWDVSKFIELGIKSNPYCQAFIENIPIHAKQSNTGEILMTMRSFLNYYNDPATLLKSYLGQMRSLDSKTGHFYEDALVVADKTFQKSIYNALICYARLSMVKQSEGLMAPQFDLFRNLAEHPDTELQGLFWNSLLNRDTMTQDELREVADWVQKFLSSESMTDYNQYATNTYLKKGTAQESFVKLIKLFNRSSEIVL